MVPEKDGNAEAEELIAPQGGQRREVFATQEHADTAIPLELVVRHDRLDIYPELLKSGVLRIYSKEGRLFFQAGGWIGFVPINDRVALEIRPRVPIGNLERILSIAGNTSPIVLGAHLQQYASSESALPGSLIDVLAERLSSLVEACWNEGLHFEYRATRRTGQHPRGRLKPFATALERVRSGNALQTVSEQFERTHDTAPNRCIAAAIDHLYAAYSSMKNRTGARAMASRLWRAQSFLAGVTRDHDQAYLSHGWVRSPELAPASRPSYPATIALAKIVLSGHGIAFRSKSGPVSLPPMMLSMEAAFEDYLRNTLASQASGIVALDGNKSAPGGASTHLFHSTPEGSPAKSTRSTPDIVCFHQDRPSARLIIDIKYKPDVTPGRDDLNQVLSYALSYQSSDVVLAYPKKGAQSPHGLQHLGTVSNVRVFTYFFDLGVDDLQAEEALFQTAIARLLHPGD